MSVKIHFLNVGHGDCTIIEHDSGHLTMIDINNSKTLPAQDEEALAELEGVSLSVFKSAGYGQKSFEDYYRSKLVDPVDYLRAHFPGKSLFRYIQSHPDLDHMSGLLNLFWVEKVALENFWDTRNGKAMDEDDFTNSPFEHGDWLAYRALGVGTHGDGTTHKVLRLVRDDLGDFWTPDGLSVLSPTADLADYCDRIENWNNGSYVIRLDYGGRRLILPGDAEKPAWDSMVEHFDEGDLKCDILKAAHHGRESGYSETAVDAMNPDVVICSVGKKPSTDASDEYRRHGSSVLSTRYHGTITVTMWGDGEVWVADDQGKRIASLPIL